MARSVYILQPCRPVLLTDDRGCAVGRARLQHRLIEAGTGWVKLLGVYRLSQGSPHCPEFRPYVKALLALRPDRLLWWSDWPHLGLRSGMPNTSDLLELFGSWVSDEADRRSILVDNPDAPFRFSAR